MAGTAGLQVLKSAMRGCFIVLVGADGSGKTTVANHIERRCQELGWRIVRSHWRPELLPSPRRFIGQKPSGDPSKPYAKPPHNAIVSAVLLLYYYLDFVLGYLAKIAPARRRGSLIINERYFYDAVFDPRRHRLRGTGWLARILANLVPKPDFVVLLHGDPSVLHSRKPELPTTDILEQQRLMLEYFQGIQGLIRADVTTSHPPEIASSIIAAILQCSQ